MNETTKVAENKRRIEKAFWQVRSNKHLIGYGPILDRFESVEHLPGHASCATDGQKFYYGDGFVEETEQAVLRTVVVHEAGHVSLHHHIRLDKILRQAGLNPEAIENGTASASDMRYAQAIRQRCNIAMDHIINNQIVQSQAYREGFLRPPKGDNWCCDRKYADSTKWSFERVLADIGGIPPRPPEEDEDEGGECEGESQDGEQDEDGSGSGDQDGDQQGDEQSDGNGGGSDQQDEQSDPTSGGGNNSEPDTGGGKQSPSRANGSVGGFGEVLPSPPKTEKEKQEEIQEIREDLARGEFMEKCMGDGSGGNSVLGRLRDADHQSPSEWGWMKELLATAYSSDRTWATRNIYHLDHGFLPGKKKSSGDLVVWADMSGSMSERDLKFCNGELQFIAEELGIRRIFLGYFDGDVLVPEDLVGSGTVFREIEVGSGEPVEFEVMGRGGTDVDPCFEATEEEGIDVQAMVVFTDGYLVCKTDDPGYPVIWATTDEAPKFNAAGRWWSDNDIERQFGEVVKLNIPRRW